MKLFVKYSRVNIVASVLALLIGSVVYYFSVRYVLIRELDDSLKVEEDEINEYVRTQGRLPEATSYRDQLISYRLAAPDDGGLRKFHHTMKVTPHSKGMDAYRELLFPIRAGGQLYTVSVAKSEEETDDLLVLMMLITPGMILLLLGTLLVANRFLLRRLWRPFYETLDSIRLFNLSSRQPLSVRPTDTEEFRELNGVVQQMTAKILRDYEMLKNFTDNASHEMQTPLAIINSRLDLLIQDADLGEHHQSVQAMYDAIGRLRQLNQSLLLLMKIENNQFGLTGLVDLSPLVGQKLVQLEDQLKSKAITVTTDLHPLQLPINDYLADILLNNLLLNAIRHNRNGGRLEVRLGNGSLWVSNTGSGLGFDPGSIFNRFTKGAHSGGTGLGLAIVKQICDNYGFSVTYSHKDGMHGFHVNFIL
ncbi:MAG: HAMP domain-containing histidine kinase [Bacteroidetes bacterium]|nr:HAMP domain-containing histidine kinase [Bacteroidota bacterium]